MSLERPDTTDNAAIERTLDELEALLGDLVVKRDDHQNAPGFVIRPDTVQETLSILKQQAGYDHLSLVSAQEYENRYESIYHLKKFDDPTQEVSIIVPADKDNPVSESAEPVFRTADWHEREAYDLIGIDYDDHPTCAGSSCRRRGKATPCRWTTTRTGRRSPRSRSTRTRCRTTTKTTSRTRCSSTSVRTTRRRTVCSI
jgi:NADH:ubiquinone oxidoreductase subunit C